MVDFVNRLKQSDEKMIEYLYDEYSSSLFRFVKSYIIDSEKSKDIVQEAYISLWNHRFTILDDSNLKSLLYKICRNLSLNQLRDNKKMANSIELSKIIDYDRISISDNYLDSIGEKDVDLKVRELIDLLPEKYREVFIRSRIEEKTYSQISKELNLSQKAVEKRMSKVLSIFREKIKKDIYIIGIIFTHLVG